MGAKEAFIAEFLTDLPEALRNHVETVIPPLVATTQAYDSENPTKNSETLSHNLNLIFKAFEGLPLAAIPLFIGQLNTVNQGILCAALEFVGGAGDIKILAPVEGGNYLGHFGITEFYRAQVIRGNAESLSVTVAGESFDLSQDENDPSLWSGEWPTAIGSYSAVFTATLDDSSSVEESVSFFVKSYPTIPAEGETHTGDTLPEIQVLIDDPTGYSGTAVLQDSEGAPLENFSLAAAAGKLAAACGDLMDSAFEAVGALPGTAGKIVYTVQDAAGQTVEWVVNFVWGSSE